MFSAAPALSINSRVFCNIFCLTGALAALATKAKYAKKVLNCFSVVWVIDSFLIGLVIALNLALTLSVPEIMNKISYFQSYKVQLLKYVVNEYINP